MFAKVTIPRPLEQAFDYQYDPEVIGALQSGDLVVVPFGRTKAIGCVVQVQEQLPPTAPHEKKFQIKDIIQKIDSELSIPEEVMKLCQFGAEFYQYSLGEALANAYAVKPEKNLGTRKLKKSVDRPALTPGQQADRKLSAEQCTAMDQIRTAVSKKPDSVFLLKGVTGSGKTEVYIEFAKEVLRAGKSILILVPEIALTSHLKDRFEVGLQQEVALWHSAIADGLRQVQWRRVKRGEVQVIVGARSAVFAPLKNLGLIIVDEEHDATYKQEDRFRYQARDLAVYRAKLAACPCILGSATPSFETLQRVQDGRYQQIDLKARFANQNLPQVVLVSLAEEPLVMNEQVKTLLAEKTLLAMQATLDRGEQVLVYLNRRGFSQFILCRDCGWIKKCSSCSISMTHYQRRNELRCHVCGVTSAIPVTCETCHGHEVTGVGSGTEALEDELMLLLKNAKVLRLDRDQITSQTRLEETLDDFRTLKANVMIGTQMVVKGHDFPLVTLVVVILADALLKWPDFRAAERAYQTLLQVSGRSGRAERPGTVMIQGYDLTHPVLQVIQGAIPVEEFIAQEVEMRRELLYPPFSRFVRFRFDSTDPAILKSKSEAIMDQLRLSLQGDAPDRVLGPSESTLFKVKGSYRYDAYFKAKTIEELVRVSLGIKTLARDLGLSVVVDVDPYSS